MRTVLRTRRLAVAGALVAPLVMALGTATASTAGTRASTSANGLIAFETERPAGDHTQADISTIQPDGTGPVRLTRTPDFNEFGPVWSRAGDQIAFWRTPAPFGTGSLWVMSGDGTGKRALTRDIDARDPSWNALGTRLVYDLASNDLYSLRVSDGQDRQRLTSGPPFDFEPAWSPNGRQIAFTRGSTTGDPGDIAILTLNGHVVSRITHSAAYDHQVGWAPAGHRLVFERDYGDRSAVFTIKPDGTDLRRLTTGAHFDVGPAYSPDAQLIAFGSDRGDILDNLWVMNSNGTDQHELVSLPFSEAFPDWQPVS
jgi:Tol biopolymer transport system component